MAASVAANTSATTVIANKDIENFFETSVSDIAEQLSKGVRSPIIPFDKLLAFGLNGVPHWQGYVQGMLNQRFTHEVDLFANTVTLHPVLNDSVPETGYMLMHKVMDRTESESSTTAATPSASSTVDSPGDECRDDKQASAKIKVARPPNSFIIYRQEWHPKIVLQNPGLHNNEISKIIGNQWRAEPEAVRNEYKRKAEERKRQHAISHPGYQYQPRKPSEKKKRMTKNKLAKLKAQANMNGPLDPTPYIQEMFTEMPTVDQHREVAIPTLQPCGTAQNQLVFNAAHDSANLLHDQLAMWNATAGSQYVAAQQANAQHPIQPTTHSTVHSLAGLPLSPAAFYGMPLSGGQDLVNVVKAPITNSMPRMTREDFSFTAGVHHSATRGPQTPIQHDPTAEVHRQERIHQDVFDEFINFDGYGDPLITGFDADNALDNFAQNYDFDFEPNTDF